jgi:hypothetical protein
MTLNNKPIAYLPAPQVTVRFGVADRVELGGKMDGIVGFSGFGKLNLLDSKWFDLSMLLAAQTTAVLNQLDGVGDAYSSGSTFNTLNLAVLTAISWTPNNHLLISPTAYFGSRTRQTPEWQHTWAGIGGAVGYRYALHGGLLAGFIVECSAVVAVLGPERDQVVREISQTADPARARVELLPGDVHARCGLGVELGFGSP